MVMRNRFILAIVILQIIANGFVIGYSRAFADVPCVGTPASQVASSPVSVVTATPTAPAPTYAFNTAEPSKRPEANNLVIYASVHDKNGYQLDGYSLHFAKDGSAFAAFGPSTSYVQGLTHQHIVMGGNVIDPGALSNIYNLKASFDPIIVGGNFSPVGKWTVYLLGRDGKQASAEQAFIVTDGDPAKELYLSYEEN